MSRILYDLQLDAPFVSRDADTHPFPRRVRYQAIGQQRAAAVARRDRHRSLNRDRLAEDVAIPQMPCFGFRFQVQATILLLLSRNTAKGSFRAASTPVYRS